MHEDATEDDHDPDETWEPPVVLSHIAYFFIALPEPLGLPDGYVIQIAEDAPGELVSERRAAAAPGSRRRVGLPRRGDGLAAGGAPGVMPCME